MKAIPGFHPSGMIRIAHESKSRFAQTVLAKSPSKIPPSSAWLMGTKSKSKSKAQKKKQKAKPGKLNLPQISVL